MVFKYPVLQFAVLSALAAFQAVQAQTPTYGEYPVPGRLEGTTAFSHEKDAERRATKSYPSWLRGNAPNSKADDSSKYFYRQFIGPKKPGYEYITSGMHAGNMQMGTLVLMPGVTYPAHNHPAREIYFIIEGEADWFVDDEKQHVTPGSVIMHRPYAVHGWTVTSKEPLKGMWVWWAESDESPEVMDKGAKLVNPSLGEKEATAKPFAVPVPQPHK
jgi:quercetin dioxygenase-like cupin family protein